MQRFIVRFRGQGPKPDDAVQRIRALKDASIVDESDRMLLVEAREEDLRTALGQGSQWLIAPERTYEVPEQPPHVIQRPPG